MPVFDAEVGVRRRLKIPFCLLQIRQRVPLRLDGVPVSRDLKRFCTGPSFSYCPRGLDLNVFFFLCVFTGILCSPDTWRLPKSAMISL